MLPDKITPTPVQLFDLQEFVSGGLSEPDWLVERWIQRQDIALVAGPAGAGKSTTCWDLAVALAEGRSWCGIDIPKRQRVLIVDEEQDEFTAGRLLMKLGADRACSDGMLHVSVGQGVRLDDSESRSRLEATIRKVRPDFILMDSVQQVFGRTAENSATGVGDAYRHLFQLRDEFGVAILLVHHVRKARPGQSLLDAVRGSTAHGTQCSTVWLAEPQGDGLMALTQAKRRGWAKQELVVRYSEKERGSRIVLDRVDPLDARSAQEKAGQWLIAFLGAQDGLTSASRIVEEATTAGHFRRTVERALRGLVENESVRRAKKGLYEVVRDDPGVGGVMAGRDLSPSDQAA